MKHLHDVILYVFLANVNRYRLFHEKSQKINIIL